MINPFSQKIVLSLLLLLVGVNTANANDQSSASYVRAFGLVEPAQDVNVLRTHAVFNRLVQVTDLPVHKSTLYVVNSETAPWAIAMPDGGVILSRGAVDICYQDAAKGDARMAFVLGHELSHLTSNDFWHRDVWFSFASGNTGKDVQQIIDVLGKEAGVTDESGRQEFLIRMRSKEITADDRGFLYAAMAGYEVDTLFEGVDDNFLTQWVNQTGSLNDPTHYPAQVRASYLIERMSILRDRAGLFDAAMRLGNFGHYDEAIDLLDTFRRDFPSKEVLNNLGYFHLRKAIKLMPDTVAYRWWMPTVAEVALPASIRTRALSKLSPAARDALAQAISYLGAAARSDSSYVNARLNLATALFYSENAHLARATVEEILAIEPANEMATAMLAPLTLAQFPTVDMSAVALQLLEPLANKPDAAPYLKYNLARLYHELDRAADAQALVAELGSVTTVPPVYLRALCKGIVKGDGCNAQSEADYLRLAVSDEIDSRQDIRPGDDVSLKRVRAVLDGWQHQVHGNNAKRIDLYRNDSGDSVAAVNGKILIVVTRPQGMTKDLLKSLGEPMSRQRAVNGELWQYSDRYAVLTDGPFLREQWFSAKATK